MTTQILEANATSGLTITGKLFARGSDTVTASAVGVERTNRKGRYLWTFTDIPAGNYALDGFVGANGGFVNEDYTLTLTDATFYPASEQIASSGGSGGGSRSWSITVTTATGTAIPQCTCWVATDIPGNNVITDSIDTNNRGEVEFLLDPGTYYLFRQKTGYTFNNPQEFTVV